MPSTTGDHGATCLELPNISLDSAIRQIGHHVRDNLVAGVLGEME